MSNYRRYFVAGGTFFFTIVTYGRRPLFADTNNVALLRNVIREVKAEQPFEICAAVVLPDHMHFIWSLPRGDDDYSKRMGRIKVKFTRGYHRGPALVQDISSSRIKRRESNIWQRRFWEHTIDDEDEFGKYFDYIHFNPVKHGLASCPHLWEASTFHHWVHRGVYESSWGCSCDSRDARKPDFSAIEDRTGEVR